MFLASLEGGAEIIAQGASLEDLYTELNKLDLADGAQIVVFWAGP